MLQHLVKQICVSKGHFRLINTHAWNNSAIKLSCLGTKMQLSKRDFKNEFKRSRPKLHDMIIITGHSNSENTEACDVLSECGWCKTFDYVGGFDQWAMNNPPPCQQPCPKPKPCEDECENSCKPPPPPPTCSTRLQMQLELSKSAFMNQYDQPKPKKSKTIIVVGGCDEKNEQAILLLFKLGYNHILNFSGGYPEWLRQHESCQMSRNDSMPTCLPSVTTPVPSQPLAAGRVLMVAMSTSVLSKVLNYEQVKALNEDILLIDVREPQELQQTGVLPKSINIPLGNIENAFKNLTAEEFHQQFNTDKPKSDKPIVFSCKAGIRSAKAMKMVESLGYTNTSNYLGGYDDWHEQTKQLLRKQ